MHYFNRLTDGTGTRFWVNNPTGHEIELAMEHHAVACTTNPSYCAKLLQSEPEYILSVIDNVVLEGGRNYDEQAMEVYARVVKRISDAFEPVYSASNGHEGFVTMQDDPRRDEDAEAVFAQVCKNMRIGKNMMAKIPVIQGGVEAIEACVSQNIPICATEVFAISQAALICERYKQATEKYGNHPPLFVTHISGIFDEYLQKIAKNRRLTIPAEVLGQAGIIIARKQFHMIKDRGYEAILLGGGARNTYHFEGLVGGDAHITINWSTAAEIIEKDEMIKNTIDEPADTVVIKMLCDALPEFDKAYNEDGLSLEEFADFGPVQLFRNAFLKGWYELLAAIAARRHANAAN